MGVLAQIDQWLARTFNPGAVAVDQSARWFGVETETFSPSNYGNYIATSTPVYTVVNLRATLLSGLPLKHYRLRKDGKRDEVNSGALWQLTRKVNSRWTFQRLMRMTEMSLCLWGGSYWFVERGDSANGTPREIWWARPDRVKVIPHPTQYVSHFEYRPVSGMEPLRFEPSETVWIPFPNPLDEYNGLSPLAAARLAADTQSAAMKQNFQLFKNGVSAGGVITPGAQPLTHDNALAIRDALSERMKGAANAHRWLVLEFDAKVQPMTLSPRDAEFIALHKLTLEDVARVYGVPQDLVGGQRTYENVDAAQRIIWEHTIAPEASFIASELTEQLLPMFGNQGADLCEFDLSSVDCLREDEEKEWTIWMGQINTGARLINEYRGEKGLDPVAWGDVWWGNVSKQVIKPVTEQIEEVAVEEAKKQFEAEQALKDAAKIEPPGDAKPKSGESGDTDTERALRALFGARTRVAYGSDEHRGIWDAFVVRTDAHEAKVKRMARKLFRAQEQSMLTELAKMERAAEPDDPDSETLLSRIFNMSRWKRQFRETIRPILRLIALDGGQAGMDEAGVGVGFDVSDPRVKRFLERQAQRFATEVNATTWDRLKASLSEGLEAGEGTDLLAKRVRVVMGDRIKSSEEVIARTETLTAYNGGLLEGYHQSGVVKGKEWLSSLDSRVRPTHQDAHGQIVALKDDFEVGGATGPGPGQMSSAAENIQCRCTLLAVLVPPEELS